MKKYLYSVALATCLCSPAFAANNKFFAHSPEAPLHKRGILLAVAVTLGLQLLRHARLPADLKRH